MAQYTHHRHHQSSPRVGGGGGSVGGGGGGLHMPPDSRFNDTSSYVTDTSSVTNPIELGFSYSNEDEGNDEISFIDSATSALTGLTGWTSANNGVGASRGSGRRGSRAGGMSRGGASALGEISELGESTNFPMAHSKSYAEYEEQSAMSGMASERISAISFDIYGSVETSLDEFGVPHAGSVVPRAGGGGKAVQFASPRPNRDDSSVVSNNSNNSKKRAPVPPLRDPNMEDTEEEQMWEEDCNYDINPTLMFLVLESHDWKESVSLLDGKGLENKNEAWNLGQLFKRKDQESADALAAKRKKELRSQARTWIIRRERNGMLRWRMLPLHAALAFNAPFEVVLRLYHLYPGAVRCRNDQGMLPLHHSFKYGNEDKILELLLDVFPEALTVKDDKGKLPIECTPKDGSDNERRSNILMLFSVFQVEMAVKKEREEAEEKKKAQAADAESPTNSVATEPGKAEEEEEVDQGTLGATPRYTTTNIGYNPMTYTSMKLTPTKKKKEFKKQEPVEEEDDKEDRYALHNSEDGENIPLNGSKVGLGLLTIPENETLSPKGRKALKSELLELGEKKKRRGIKKLFKKRNVQI